MKTSDAGRAFITRWEGLRLEAYLCPAGVWTIGVGHTRDVQKGDTITTEEADALLRADLAIAERAVLDGLRVGLQQHEFDALVSLVFNIGSGAWRTSTARQRLNLDNRKGAADAITWWNKATVNGKLVEVVGLVRRRKAEMKLFLTADYGD